MSEKWWTLFQDEQLDALVTESLDGNFTLQAAWDRLDQARALARKQGAALWPSLDGSAGLSRTVQETDAAGRTYQTEYALGLSASYELDLWGRVRSTRDVAILEAQATEEDLRAAALSLSAQVASTWYNLIEQRLQLELLRQQIATNRNYLELVRLRFRKGEVSVTDVLQQQKLLESTRTETADVQANIDTLEHQLGVLTGQVPTDVEFPSQTALPKIPAFPATGVLAEWVQKRPDIRAAFLRVRSNNQSVAAAIADRFPKISITGDLSTTGAEPSLLFEQWLARLAGNLSAPLFDAGRRRAEVDRTRAAASEALHAYGQTLLDGIREVEDALTIERRQRETIRGIQTQLSLSNRTVKQLVYKYRNGTVDFLRVLDELQTQQSLQRNLLGAKVQLLQDRIDLYLALGGGWDLERPPGKSSDDSLRSTKPKNNQKSDAQENHDEGRPA